MVLVVFVKKVIAAFGLEVANMVSNCVVFINSVVGMVLAVRMGRLSTEVFIFKSKDPVQKSMPPVYN